MSQISSFSSISATSLSPVTFHGDTIFCIEHQNQPYTPAKPIVENLGIAWQTQARKLSDNRKRWGVTIMVIPSESGEQETLCLPVRKLPAFLASINPRKVRPELRERIELYQAECDDALWDYWMHGKAERPAPGPARNIADDIIPTPPYAPALGWADAPLTRVQERVISEKQRGRCSNTSLSLGQPSDIVYVCRILTAAERTDFGGCLIYRQRRPMSMTRSPANT